MGNESSIRIWRDQWIPRESSLAVLRKKHHNRLYWVLELIDQQTNTWNMQTVNELFHSPDVEEILKLKLPLRGQMDFVARHYEKSGIFQSKVLTGWAIVCNTRRTKHPAHHQMEVGLYGIMFGKQMSLPK